MMLRKKERSFKGTLQNVLSNAKAGDVIWANMKGEVVRIERKKDA